MLPGLFGGIVLMLSNTRPDLGASVARALAVPVFAFLQTPSLPPPLSWDVWVTHVVVYGPLVIVGLVGTAYFHAALLCIERSRIERLTDGIERMTAGLAPEHMSEGLAPEHAILFLAILVGPGALSMVLVAASPVYEEAGISPRGMLYWCICALVIGYLACAVYGEHLAHERLAHERLARTARRVDDETRPERARHEPM